MKILVANDDGYLALGIRSLVDALRSAGHEVVACAPDRNRSAASQALTLSQPLRLCAHAEGWFSVDGTPVDAVQIALNGGLDFTPELVISGINHGANLGTDVLYSGTVACATEAFMMGVPAIAVSLCSPNNEFSYFSTAASIAVDLAADWLQSDLSKQCLLNVNVPDLPLQALSGQRSTTLARRDNAGIVIRETDPRGAEMFWIGPPGPVIEPQQDSDYSAIELGFVSATALGIDRIKTVAVAPLDQWLKRQ